jgi:prepilin-type N-terminal cleavage/methylation domain-containing protein
MNDRCDKSSPAARRPPRRRGLTLVEVVAGLALLSTLLVAVLTTKARVTRQWSHAQRKLQAVAAADRLLAEWWPRRDVFPRQSSGRVAGDSGLHWQTTPVGNSALNGMRTSVIRLDIVEGRASRPADEVLASVEVILDDELPRGTSTTSGGAS